jgi:cobalt/nickel transport protein
VTRRRVTTVLLVLAVVAAVALPLVRGAGSGPTPYAGTDAQAAAMVERGGYEPWVAPLLAPGSPEVESGLFAAQAALGGVVLGYVLGRLHPRRAPGSPGAPRLRRASRRG